MRCLIFSRRCAKEILRDPLNIIFGLGFPVVILLLLSAIQSNVPVPLFEIQHLAPGVTVFGLSFVTLFSATLIAKDRESAFLQRLYTTPLRSRDYILGYMLPVFPIAIGQSTACYAVAMMLGMPFSFNLIIGTVIAIPVSVLYIGLGLLCGSVCNVKQVGGLCGALLTNLSAWLSGIWFDLELVGGTFQKIAYLFPFVHAVELERAAIAGNLDGTLPHLLVVLGYAALITTGAVFLFLRQMKNQ